MRRGAIRPGGTVGAAAAVVSAFLLTLALAPAAGAAVIPVTTAGDSSLDDAFCSLREAVTAANQNSNVHEDACVAGEAAPDQIELHLETPVTYPLLGAGDEDSNASGDLDIFAHGGPLTIAYLANGSGIISPPVIDAAGNDRVIDIRPHGGTAAEVTVRDLTLANGAVAGSRDGGAILVDDPDAKLLLERVTIRDSRAGDYGGAISFDNAAASAGLELVDSELSGNSAGDDGGAVYINRTGGGLGGGPRIERSTFAGNTSAAFGGALYLGAAFADVTGSVVNSTFSGNSATGGGGAIGFGFSGIALRLDFVTIAGNSTPTAGRAGGIQTDAPDQYVTLGTTIIAGNTAAGQPANCARIGGPFTASTSGYNIESADSCDLDRFPSLIAATATRGGPPLATDLVNTDPLLAPLADNGGPTRTRGLYDGSPAIGRVPVIPDDACAPSEGVDQRGVNRTVDEIPPVCDVGAFEGSVGPAPRPPIAVRCGGRRATRVGTARRDVIRGTPRADVIAGLGGNDVIRGFGGNDVICGGRGKDRLIGGAGRDRLLGQAGNDVLLGGPGMDVLLGGPGKDVLRGGPGRDKLRGGPGRDKLFQ